MKRFLVTLRDTEEEAWEEFEFMYLAEDAQAALIMAEREFPQGTVIKATEIE